MNWFGLSAIACTLCLTLLATAQDAALQPSYERLLKGADAQRAEQLAKRADELAAADDYAGAIAAAEDLLALRQRVQGQDHWETVDAKWSLDVQRKIGALPAVTRADWRKAVQRAIEADQLAAKGMPAKAQQQWEEYCRWCEQVFGDKHPYTATSYNNLAYNLNAQGKYAEAQPYCQKALDLSREVLGEQHPSTAENYNNLAHNLEAQGKDAVARPLLQKSLDLFRELFGEKHTSTATGYNNLARNLKAQGKYAEAEPLYQRALDLFRERLGEKHTSTATSYNNLAMHLSEQGKYAEAKPLNEKALEIRRELLGEKHPDVAASYNNLALNLKAQGRYTDAQPLFQTALELVRQTLGEKHPQTAISYSNLATILDKLGKYADAGALHRKALEMRLELYGQKHPDVATSYNNLAMHLHAQRNYTDAQPLYEQSLDLLRELLSEKHPETATCYHNLAHNLEAQAKYAEAQPLYERVLDMRRELLGEVHPGTANSYYDLSLNLHVQGKHADAQTVLLRGVNSFEASRLAGASGLERGTLELTNPHLLLAALQAKSAPAAGWSQMEMTLARGLLDEQAVRKVTSPTPAELDEQTKALELLSSLQREILALAAKSQRSELESTRLAELGGARRQAEERMATLAVQTSEREVAPLATIQESLPNGAALLFWLDVAGTQEHWGCILRASGDPHWERLPGTGRENQWTRTDIELPDKLRRSLSQSNAFADVATLAKALHAQRLAPMARHLVGVKELYIVPAYSMVGVPVEILTQDYTISYVPSGTFLARLKSLAKPSGNAMLALADPTFAQPVERPMAATALPPGGLLLTRVAPGGAADQAGLKAGDVLLKYGDAELSSLEQLTAAIGAGAAAKSIPVTVWREDADRPLVRELAPGKLGVVLDREAAPLAIAGRRKGDAMLLALRGGDWIDLPGTRVEASRIGKLFGNSATMLADSSASEQHLEKIRQSGELKQYRYLHFATHGEGNDVRAFESALILAQDSLTHDSLPRAGQPYLNGRLTASEVLEHWKLNAELVTLSACESAVGRQGSGDGALGFAQAFLTAGSRAVCLSLWKVDDAATMLLMDRFYLNLLGKRPGLAQPLAKAAALAEAKNWLRNLPSDEALKLTADMTQGVVRGKGQPALPLVAIPKSDDPVAAQSQRPFQHPKYWAAFILVGDPH